MAKLGTQHPRGGWVALAGSRDRLVGVVQKAEESELDINHANRYASGPPALERGVGAAGRGNALCPPPRAELWRPSLGMPCFGGPGLRAVAQPPQGAGGSSPRRRT